MSGLLPGPRPRASCPERGTHAAEATAAVSIAQRRAFLLITTEVQRNKRQLTCRELLTQIMVRHNNRLPGGDRTMSPDRTTTHRGSRALWHWIAALAFVAAGAFAAAATAQ